MTKKNNEKILKDLAKIYINLYPAKDILCDKKLFKYSSDDIEDMINHFTCANTSSSSNATKKPKVPKKQSILSTFTTRAEAEDYYLKNMIYDRNSEVEEEKMIKKHSAPDFKILHFLLYNSNTNLNKKEILYKIQQYFSNLNRAKSM